VGDRVLQTIFSLISCDEAAHAGFYRSLITIDMERDREGTTVDLVYVILRFKMPGDGLVPNYHDKLLAAGRAYDRKLQIKPQLNEKALISSFMAFSLPPAAGIVPPGIRAGLSLDHRLPATSTAASARRDA
jgi:hypothetical protein